MFRQQLYDLEDSLPDLEFPELIRTFDARAGPYRVDKDKAEHEPKTNNSEVKNDDKTIPTTQTAQTGDSSTKFEANALDGRRRND